MMTEKPEASPHGDELREAAARAIWQAGANASTSKWENASHDAKLIVYQKADAALSLMQPEIDRRVNAAIATMLERLRNLPNEMADSIAKKHFVSFEVAKLIGRDLATAFQQENSDAATDR